MTSIAKTERQQSLNAEQLLQSRWTYTESLVLETESLDRHAQHRVLTRWRDEQGAELCFLLNFIAGEQNNQQLVMPSSQCCPEIDRRARLLDRYGFEVHCSSRRALQWDLLMHLDLDTVSNDLQKRLFAH